MGYDSATNRDTLESVAARRTNRESLLHRVKWTRKEKQMPVLRHTYSIWKMLNLFAGKGWRGRYRERTRGTAGEGGEERRQ